MYAAGFSDPGAHPEFWRRWNEFEVAHSDESTFREMLRLKRTMAAAGHASVQVTVISTMKKRPCTGQHVEDCRTLQQEYKRMCVGVAL